ncbi:MAG: fibronectin type III domain-containing protein, partial [Acidimicrobiia bacterium]|nr:fibronectin type III domain-containing protein [Acidimicrobiia bacterium]
MDIVITLTWDSPMHAYETCDGSGLVGDTNDPRVPSMYYVANNAVPWNAYLGSCGSGNVTFDLSDDFLTMRWIVRVTAPTSAGTHSMYAYSRGTTFFDSSYNYSNTGSVNYSVTALDPPGVPSVTAVTGSDSQVAVAWSAPSDIGGSPITGYEATSSGGQTCTAGASDTDCTVTSLTNGTSYTFTVRAANGDGYG